MDASFKTYYITPQKNLFDLRLNEIWAYRDLLVLFIKRDITVSYKQTVLGPLWFIIQPIFTTLIFVIIFRRIAGISTDGIPPILFYLGGVIVWNYFADCLRLTSDTFVKNSGIFGKVYFPRVIVPLSVVISNLVKFAIQFIVFVCFFIYYLSTGSILHPNFTLVLIPVYILILSAMGLAFGLLISGMTTKYRDFTFLMQFGIQLWMYATPVIYPISQIPEKYRTLVMLNPISPLVEAFRYGFTGSGAFDFWNIGFILFLAILLLIFGITVFNRVERTFIDIV
jgi:lipopolysaccharide transport system permease protein